MIPKLRPQKRNLPIECPKFPELRSVKWVWLLGGDAQYGAGAVESKAESYREHAAICSELARVAKDAESEVIFVEMSRVWLRLAKIVDRFELT